MTHCPYSYFEYQVQPGDTFKTISQRFSVSEQSLRDRNRTGEATPGARLKIPCAQGGCGQGAFYTVRRGESLLRIARRHGMAMADLLDANPYLNPDNVEAGQVIIIPPLHTTHSGGDYTLADNEGLFDVLRKFGMDVTTFCKLNPGVNPMDVRPGQRVQVQRHTEHGGRWYTLGPDENLVSVANRHGLSVSVLLSANERLRPSDFVPGMPVRIPADSHG